VRSTGSPTVTPDVSSYTCRDISMGMYHIWQVNNWSCTDLSLTAYFIYSLYLQTFIAEVDSWPSITYCKKCTLQKHQESLPHNTTHLQRSKKSHSMKFKT
jgi:hypothetical protein